MPRSRVLAPALLALIAAALYLPRLEDAPLFLVRDELFSALTAHAVATTGRDPHGTFLPLYFQMDLLKHGSPMWFQPFLIYAMTASIKTLSFSQSAIRLPMAIVGTINVVLMYCVGRLLFKRELFAVAAAMLLALTPTHFMYSRYAMDFQAPLPFLLGWLVCVLMYMRKNDPRLLFAAGLILGIGIYTYVAAVAFMPFYAVLTCVVLYRRRDRPSRYGLVAAGVILPALLCIPFLLQHPTIVRDVALHYQPDEVSEQSGAMATIGSIFSADRIAQATTLYVNFWNPRFLFIDGPLRFTEATWLVGVFLMPVFGLLIIGVVTLLRTPLDPRSLLLLGGLFTAPIPASFAGQGEAIRRALELMPFAVLIATVGLEQFWTERRRLVRLIAFIAFWGAVIALGLAGHEHVPHAQAFVRAASMPLVVAGLMLAFEGFRPQAPMRTSAVITALGAVALAQIAYRFGGAVFVNIALAAVVVAAMWTNDQLGASTDRRQTILMLLLALMASVMTFYYVDYPVQRIAGIPASLIVFALRSLAACGVIAGSWGAIVMAARLSDRMNEEVLGSIAIVLVAIAQVAYFYVDLFTFPGLRFVHVAVVAILAVAASTLARRGTTSDSRLGSLTAIGLVGFVCLQFAYFYVDYFKGFQARGSGTAESNVRLALERAIDIAGDRPIPAIYLARVRNEFGGLGKFYADFYLIKKHREDLIDRTTEGDVYGGFELDRLLQLPRGSLIIVNPSGKNDPVIDRMVSSGDVKKHERLLTPDGTPMFWILERGG